MLTIVTAASRIFARSLYQFLLSAERHGLSARHSFVIYDLGMGEGELRRLQRRFDWAEFRRFAFEKYPAHVAVRDAGKGSWRAVRGNYAWKPLIVAEMAAETSGYLLWLDSATLIKTSDLKEVVSALKDRGLYILRGQSPLVKRADPATLTALNTRSEWLHRPEIVTGVIGFDCSRPNIRSLIDEWKSHALIEAHIWPSEPPLPGHRPEQSLLTILLYRGEAEGEFVLEPGEVDISSRAPVRWLTTRNKVANWVPRAADSLARAYYLIAKKADRVELRWTHWRTSRFDGFLRRAREHYSVYVARESDGRRTKINAPRSSYFADPFVWTRNGRAWLFVEEFEYFKCRGRICCVELDAELRAGPPIPLLDLDCHASFPFLFEHDGALYMVPETHNRLSIDLYVCEEFPLRWRLRRRMVFGVHAADSVLVHRNGLWWLITSQWEGEGALPYLAIYFSRDVLNGEWLAHPVNEERRYAGLPFTSYRNGGPLMADGDALIRIAQDNRHYYGEALQFFRIDELSPTAYRETPVDGLAQARFIEGRFAHHLSAHGGLVAWDVRDRTGRFR